MAQTIKPILVTGAGGGVGSVSGTIVDLLRKQNLPVRALVRRDDHRAQALRELGAEVVIGDLTQLSDVHRAIHGCGRIFFSITAASKYLEASLNTIAVAKHYNVEVFVNMSQVCICNASQSLLRIIFWIRPNRSEQSFFLSKNLYLTCDKL
jgi:nucleoside-diphosphate-sugar epimerase